MAERICPNCHSIVGPKDHFCTTCGKELSPNLQAPDEVPSELGIKCPQCSKTYPSPIPFCDYCGYPLIKKQNGNSQPDVDRPRDLHPKPITAPTSKSNPPVLSNMKQFLKKLPLKRIAIFGTIIILLAVAGKLVYPLIPFQPKQPTTNPPPEPCVPIKPGDEFDPANQTDLAGNLKRDSYFMSGKDYKIADESTLEIPSGRTLLIEPGARVRFGRNAKLVVKGKLLACGQTNRRILFTADTSTGAPGYWQGIEFQGSDPDSILGHVTIEFGGGENHHSPVWIDQLDLKLQDIRFDNNAWYAISIDSNSVPLVRDSLKVENGPDGWEVRGGLLIKSRKWNNTQAYVINGILEIQEDAGLDLSAGTVLRFLPSSGLKIRGDFQAAGTAKEPILLTSVSDEISADHPDPTPGDWIGVQILGSKAKPVMDYVNIRYAGQRSDLNSCLWFGEASGSFTNIQINNCASSSFLISSDVLSNPVFENLTLEDSDILQELEVRGGEFNQVVKGVIPRIKAKSPDRYLLPVVTSWIRVGKDAALAVEPGTVVLFRGGRNSGIAVEGILKAPGTEADPIVFSSWHDSLYDSNNIADPGDWGGVYLKNNTSVTDIENLELRFAGVEGAACIYLENASPVLKGVSIKNCAVSPISSDINSQPDVADLDLENNLNPNQWSVRESTTSGRMDLVWDAISSKQKAQITRVIEGMVTFGPDTNLTLKPGLVLKFKQAGGLSIQGSFTAQGMNNSPILLTSWRDPAGGGEVSGAQPGDWQGIRLAGNENQKILLQYLNIRYAGKNDSRISCLTLLTSKPVLENITISDCDYYPIGSDIASQPTISNISLLGNLPSDDWAVYESHLQDGQQAIWKPISIKAGQAPIPRIVTGWLNIDPGAKLTVSEGGAVKFLKNVGMACYGTLEILGSDKNPVIFTSWRDPQFSDESGVQAGDWSGIYIQDADAETQFQDTYIRYAGGDARTRGSLVMQSSSPSALRVHITDGAWYPISMDLNSDPHFDSILLENNQPGNVIEVRQSTLDRTGEHTWVPWVDADTHLMPRVVTGKLIVNKNSTLILKTGTVIKFTDTGTLEINGGLSADGTIFTSAGDPDYPPIIQVGNPGWTGITAKQTEGIQIVKLSNASIIRNAKVGLWVDQLSIDITDTSIENCSEAAISVDPYAVLRINGLNLKNNALNGALVHGNQLANRALRWGKIADNDKQVVRVVRDPFRIAAGATLSLDPGVIIKFSESGKFVVEGKLKTGTSADAIDGTQNMDTVIFTALGDDDAGGDTDNESQTPVRGAWPGLDINPNNTNAGLELINTSIRYANTGLRLTNLPDWVFTDLYIMNSQLFPVSCDALSLFPTGINLVNNGEDVFACPTADRK
jgi:hypothetical protein